MLAHIRGLLLDLDGTIYEGEETLPGALEFVSALREQGYPFRFVTNTTSRCRATLVVKLRQLGIAAKENDVFAPPYAAAQYLHAQTVVRACLLVQEDARRDFEGIAHTAEGVSHVVVGDLGRQWTYEELNQAFRLLMEGAELIALGKTRYWHAPDGLQLDAGPFVAALEYASGKEARVLGKPAAPFFRQAVNDLGLSPEQVAMVGDDIEMDVGGAQQMGLTGILVCTGKFREEDLDGPIKPELVVGSMADLMEHIRAG